VSARVLRFRRTNNVQFDQFQRELDDATRTVLGSPFATGQAIRGVALSTAAKGVAHGLPQPLQNWIVIRLRGAAPCSIIEIPQANALYASQVMLKASAACVVDLWVS
jgi:hypothetical protein